MRLKPRSPLDGYSQSIGALRLEEVPLRALVSITAPLGGEDALAAAIKKAHGVATPAPGKSVVAGDGARLTWMAPGQIFAAFDSTSPWPARAVAEALGDAGYYVDQSDAWVTLRLSGPTVRQALERICPVDLHPDVFAVNDAARTGMEHLGALIIRENEDSFLLMSASSSAKSFLHAVETSARNIA